MIQAEKERMVSKAVEAAEQTVHSGITAKQHVEIGGRIYKVTIERL